MERFKTWPWPFSYLAMVGLAYFFGLMDVLTIGIAAPAIAATFGVSAAPLAALGGTLSLVGYVIGALGFSHISDAYGRRAGLTITLISYSVGSLWTALSPNVINVYASRLLTGVGIGADLAIAAAYLGELSPHGVRGRFQSFGTFLGFVGAGVTPFIGLLIIPAFSWGWRLFFVIGSLGALSLLYIRRVLPESPRWLISKGRVEDASRIVSKAEEFYKKKYGVLPPVEQSASKLAIVKGGKVPTLSLVTDRRYLTRLAILLPVFVLYYIYTYPYLVLTTSFLSAAGYTIASSLLIPGIGGFGFALGAFLSYVFSDYIERKYLISLLLFIQGLAMFAIGIKGPVPEEVGAYFLAAFSNTFLATALYIYAVENFPTRARSTGVAFTDGLGHIGGIFSLPFALSLFLSLGFSPTYYILGAFALVAAAVVLPGILSTRRKLEELTD
ncbi:MFS transporter [Sulfodiicoccus acidiphilus]|uniref:MFS transporter n=2 Tax=Sulfodiicoccus acidiphilus TaxID=1670455 RepID=A0A348B1K5_9CREN|nr:MFS transporter [Sulfodiicoccus acidiphilus]GGU00086.1 MFS transporter [Sulfodiicoccus acidiphilus]